MKQRVTKGDLDVLTKSQRIKLRELWVPRKYQTAVAEVCVNVETDECVGVEFSIGEVFIHPKGVITLQDLHAAQGYYRLRQEEDEYEEPMIFLKEQSLPLFNIGDMIEFMDNLDFKNFHFYLLAGTGVMGCEVGNFRSPLKEKILTEGYKAADLCDVLWNMIVAQL